MSAAKSSHRRNTIYLTVFVVSILALTLSLTTRQIEINARKKLTWIAELIQELADTNLNIWSIAYLLLRRILGLGPAPKPFRFHRPSQFDKISQLISPLTQQTKGQLLALMGFLDDCLLGLTGKNWEQLNEPVRKKWNEAKWIHEPMREHGSWAYHAVPRADLILTAIGTALTVMATRKALRRFRTAQEIPLEHFRRQKKLKGYIISVNDSDNVRFYHTSFLSRFFFRRPNIKRTDLKYETINVRLAGIDAPEMAHFGGDCQPYAKEAKEWLTKFAEGRRATIQLLRYDQYSRAVASVHTGWPWKKNISVEMVKAGFATIYEDGGAEYGSFEPELRRHLKEAQSKRKGMWKQSWASYISPSQYKKNLRLAQDPSGSTTATSPAFQNSLSDKWKPSKWAFWK